MSPRRRTDASSCPRPHRLIVAAHGEPDISMLKLTSLCLVIGLAELTTTAQIIYGRNFQQIPMLLVASIWYLALTTILTLIQSRLEKRVGREVTQMGTRPKRVQSALMGDAR